jgi:hypothetical protein
MERTAAACLYTRRAIDFHEGKKIDEEALKDLVGAAVTLNKSRA